MHNAAHQLYDAAHPLYYAAHPLYVVISHVPCDHARHLLLRYRPVGSHASLAELLEHGLQRAKVRGLASLRTLSAHGGSLLTALGLGRVPREASGHCRGAGGEANEICRRDHRRAPSGERGARIAIEVASLEGQVDILHGPACPFGRRPLLPFSWRLQ